MSEPEQQRPVDGRQLPQQVTLWIDGVGTWLVWTADEMTIGGPSSGGGGEAGADLQLLADLPRRHSMITREQDAYSLIAWAPARVNNRRVTEPCLLRHGDQIALGEEGDVRWRFHIPSPLSHSARIDFLTGHRPARRVDGITWLEQALVIGPRTDHHIPCAQLETEFVLFRRAEQLWGRCANGWSLNGASVTGSATLNDGDVVEADTLRFRTEFGGSR